MQWLKAQAAFVDLSELIPSLNSLRTATATGRTSTETYRTTIAEQRALNLSQALNGACDHLGAVIGRTIEDQNEIIKFIDDALTFLAAQTPPNPESTP